MHAGLVRGGRPAPLPVHHGRGVDPSTLHRPLRFARGDRNATRLGVLLDGGVEGDWRWTALDLANTVTAAGAESSVIVGLLREAEQRADEPALQWSRGQSPRAGGRWDFIPYSAHVRGVDRTVSIIPGTHMRGREIDAPGERAPDVVHVTLAVRADHPQAQSGTASRSPRDPCSSRETHLRGPWHGQSAPFRIAASDVPVPGSRPASPADPRSRLLSVGGRPIGRRAYFGMGTPAERSLDSTSFVSLALAGAPSPP